MPTLIKTTTKGWSDYFNIRQCRFHSKDITKNLKSRFKMTKGVFYQEGTAILNVYAANNKATKYIKQKLIICKKK